jgi:GNAT superfamily N-acetyltransferase
MNTITFETVSESGLDEFKKRLQTAFSLVLIEQDEKAPDKPVPADRDIERNYYSQEAETYNIYASGQRIGGVILTTNRISNHNHLDFFFIDPEYHSKGIGYAVWKAIEAKYPETEVWQTGTPYFEKRNIHFYVNKCGFQINEFYCEHHPDPNFPQEERSEGNVGMDEGFFNFIKIMKPQRP